MQFIKVKYVIFENDQQRVLVFSNFNCYHLNLMGRKIGIKYNVSTFIIPVISLALDWIKIIN